MAQTALKNHKGYVTIPRKEYEAFLEFKKYKEVKLTAAQKKSLARAENNLRNGKTLTYDELISKLGIKN